MRSTSEFAHAVVDHQAAAGNRCSVRSVLNDVHARLNPAVPAPRKRGAMEQIAQRAGFTPIVSKLLILLADRDRLSLLDDIAASYHDLLADRQNVVRAEVTSAEPLSTDRLQAIEQRLATMTGKRVSMTAKVDKDIIGGVVARVGSTVYDASIATQLKKIRERLTT